MKPISLKGGLHSIQSSIAAKVKIASLVIRLEALTTKEPAPMNQVSPSQVSTPGCTYCQGMNHVFEECPIFLAQQMLLEHINVTFSRPHNNPYKRTISAREITRISHGVKTFIQHNANKPPLLLVPLSLLLTSLKKTSQPIMCTSLQSHFQIGLRTITNKLYK